MFKNLFLILLTLVIFLLPATTHSYEAETGDIACWMFPIQSPGEGLYLFQTQIASYETKLVKLKLLRPFWGYPTLFWDDTTEPLNERAFCGHIEPLFQGKELLGGSCKPPFIAVILRPTANGRSVLDLNAMLDAHDAITENMKYKIPFFDVEELFYDQLISDFVPMKSTDQSYSQYVNILESGFFNRYYHCGTATAWSIVFAQYVRVSQAEKIELIDRLSDVDVVRSIDLVTPGFICSWLVRNKLYEVAYTINYNTGVETPFLDDLVPPPFPPFPTPDPSFDPDPTPTPDPEPIPGPDDNIMSVFSEHIKYYDIGAGQIRYFKFIGSVTDCSYPIQVGNTSAPPYTVHMLLKRDSPPAKEDFGLTWPMPPSQYNCRLGEWAPEKTGAEDLYWNYNTGSRTEFVQIGEPMQPHTFYIMLYNNGTQTISTRLSVRSYD